MDELESFINENMLTIKNVRNLVDDYSLISYYIGEELELNTKYSSPLREGDENPSFSIFYGYGDANKDVLYFKDQAEIGSGTVLEFLKLYLKASSIRELLEQINFDLQLGLDFDARCSGLKPTQLKKIPIIKERPDIKIVSQPYTIEFLKYWKDKYEVTEEVLRKYNVKCCKSLHYIIDRRINVITPRSLCIAYTIGQYYKIYCPFETKDLKFRNNYPNNYVEGHLQLDWSRSDLLVITKSTKECIFFRQHFDIQAIAGKSETTLIQENFMLSYLSHFKRVVLWLDQDETGVMSAKKYLSLYPSLELAIVPFGLEKDPTDIFEVRRNQGLEIIKQILKL